MPESITNKIEMSFESNKTFLINKDQSVDAPAFDMIRASVNLMVAGILISIATAMKLPLSTTYVTFMVAMGTSLADRAWGRESAVYRVAGVVNVIGGWFLTALGAFIASGIVVFLIRECFDGTGVNNFLAFSHKVFNGKLGRERFATTCMSSYKDMVAIDNSLDGVFLKITQFIRVIFKI